MQANGTVLVIGAGIIGLCSALELQRRGHSVTILDRKGVAAEASRGNAGAFAFTDIIPLATPGIMNKAPKWLLDPLGPLSIPPRYAARILPWMLRFWRASQPGRAAASTAAQASLMLYSQEQLDQQLFDTGLTPMLRREGQLQVYESLEEFENSKASWDLRGRHGVEFKHVMGRHAVADVQPGLSDRFMAGTFTPGWSNISDPADYATRLSEIFQERGGRIGIAEVSGIRSRETDVCVELGDGYSLEAPQVVICAGAWSHKLAAQLGDNIPLETERGYNTTLKNTRFKLRTHLSFAGHGFVVSQIGDGIRVGGAVELGGLELPPNFARARALMGKARRFLPELDLSEGEEWMGFRPSLPDTLPVIGPSSNDRRVLYAFGHGHLGLTQSSGTASLVADLIDGADPAIDITPFRASRF